MNKIVGFEKLSLVDFDSYVTCTIFVSDCNFRCPFCHNSSLVIEKDSLKEYKKEEILSYLESRKKMIDAVCISGGEPTLYKGLDNLIDDVKKLGFLVKLDTNGSNYEVLKRLISEKKIDYVAMDVKNGNESYFETIGLNKKYINLYDNVLKSIELLKKSDIEYEFRTTLVNEFHKEKDIYELRDLVSGAKKLFLQKFVDRGTCIRNDLHEVSLELALKYKEILEKEVKEVNLRGY